MEISGRVIEVCPIERGTSSRGPWAKAAVVIRYEDGQFPKDIVLTNLNKAEEFAKLQVGYTGVFKFDAKSHKSNNGKWYCDLNCWSWTTSGNGAPVAKDEPF